MQRKTRLLLILLAGAGLTCALALSFHRELRRWVLESALNQGTRNFFDGTLRVGSVDFDRGFGIQIEGLEGQFKWGSTPVVFEVQTIRSGGPVTEFFSREGLGLSFERMRFRNSKTPGIRGVFRIRGAGGGSFDLQAEVQGVDLHEIEWVSPGHLSGATGKIRGEIILQRNSTGFSARANLRIEEPGGLLPPRFFSLLTPYLPQRATRRQIQGMTARGGRVGFRNASLEADWVESGKMKMFLQIALPDYNLNLNVNLEVRLH